MKSVEISDRIIGKEAPPFIVAEMSGNHNQSLERALRIVEAAKKAGCHGLKIQTYTADTMTLDSDRDEFQVKDEGSPWTGRSLHALYRRAYTPWEWHAPIFDRCKELGMIGFSTPFDESAVAFLESLDAPVYKIASFENTDLPLIETAARTGKPIMISTGMASAAELDEAVQTARKNGRGDVILLKCTSSYPSDPEESNLRTIPHLEDLFDVICGLSDHTPGIGVAMAGVALGACVIEKHFTLSRADGGVDSAFSMEPDEMKLLVDESVKAHRSLGKIHYGPTAKEKKSLRYRRSLFAVASIRKGAKFTTENIRRIRPGHGLAPRYYQTVLGRTAALDIRRGAPIRWECIA